MPERLGVFGGSFDPIHVGHLTLVRHARGACELDEVVFVPVGDPPHKPGPVAPGEDRLAMVELAVRDEPDTSVSRIEVDRAGKSYTVDTLGVLGEGDGERILYLLIGADNAVDMASWHDPERVLDLANVTVLCRPGWEHGEVPDDLAERMTFLDSPLIDCSSTDIRERVSRGLPIDELVGRPVAGYIEAHRLYGG